MPSLARSFSILAVVVISPISVATSAEPTVLTCRTQSDCISLEIQQADAARRVEYDRMVKDQTATHAAVLQVLNANRARVAGNREAKLQQILQRRRDAYARAHP